MTTPVSERQEILDDVSTVAIRDLVGAWAALSLTDLDFAEVMTATFVEIASSYSGVAANLAANWYVESAPAIPWEPLVAPPPNVEALTKSAEWALGADGEIALNRMSGTLQRSIFDGMRETIVLNAQAEPGSRWVRHARADACAFCRLLATRHDNPRYWYKSNISAIDVVGRSGRPSGKRRVGSTGYHDHCRCVAVEVRPGQGYEPPEYVQQWNEQYAKARANAGRGDMKSILSAWREQGVK